MTVMLGERIGWNFCWLCAVLLEDKREVFKMFNRQMVIDNMNRTKGMVRVRKSRYGMEEVGMGSSGMSLTLLGIIFLS